LQCHCHSYILYDRTADVGGIYEPYITNRQAHRYCLCLWQQVVPNRATKASPSSSQTHRLFCGVNHMKHILADKAPPSIGPYTQAVQAGNFVFLSGQIPLEYETGKLILGDISKQTEQVIHNIKTILIACNSDISRVVKTTCYLLNMADFAAFNEVYARHFTNKPARSCVVVAAIPQGALVEIEVIAEYAP